MEIRRLAKDDLPALAGLYKQFWGEESVLESMRAVFERIEQDPRYAFLVAEHEGRIAGSAMGVICDELYGDCRPFMVIEDVIVDKGHRRLGIGAALMIELERLAGESACSMIIFVSEAERTDAHRFYESLGYKPDAYRGFKKRL